MAAACGTLLGTGLLAGVISFGGGEVEAEVHNGNVTGALFHEDGDGAYSARVIIDGVPLRMIVDTGAAQSSLSLQDAARLGLPRRGAGVSRYAAAKIDIAGQTLQGFTLEVSQSSSQSAIGLNLLSQLGPVTLDPAQHSD